MANHHLDREGHVWLWLFTVPLPYFHILSHSFFFLILIFIYFWLRWVFVAACRLSLVVASRGYSSLRCAGLSLSRPLLLRSTGSRVRRLSSCGARA